MSTDAGTRRARTRRRRSRAFLVAFTAVIAVLGIVGLAGAAVTTAQGPRVTRVSVDPDAAVSAAGSRLIFTTTQSLAEVSPDQVSVSPATAFTVDTSGRSVGVRFAMPLWDDTEYTVTISGVTGVGGGPATTITKSFLTPPLQSYVLQRATGGDTVFRTDLAGDAGHFTGKGAKLIDHAIDGRRGAQKFAQATQQNVGRPFAIILDNQVISAPVIEGRGRLPSFGPAVPSCCAMARTWRWRSQPNWLMPRSRAGSTRLPKVTPGWC